MQFDEKNFRLESGKNISYRMLGLGVVVFLISFIGYFMDSKQFFFSYLVAYTFWVSIGLGALFFVMLGHLTGAVWSLSLRRVSETVMIVLPYLAILFIPLLFGLHDLYKWTHQDKLLEDVLLAKKSGYLNSAFFVIRTVAYFAIWYFLARKLYKTSVEQDNNPKAEQIKTMRKISAGGMVLYALTVSFAAFDWLMSLDAHWYSTIFGLYFFAGGFLAALAFIVIFVYLLRGQDVLKNQITVEHYHDMAKLIFGFTIFWGYMAFSQYFLIWYANIPEETIFYLYRWEGSWKVFSLALVFGNFLFPFVALMTRAAKRNLKFLIFVSIWILVTHWIDLYWLALPNLHHHGIHLSWVDLSLFVGIGAIFLGLMWMHFADKALVPAGDPKLTESFRFENA